MSDQDSKTIMEYAANEIGRDEAFAYSRGHSTGSDYGHAMVARDILGMVQTHVAQSNIMTDREFLNYLEKVLQRMVVDYDRI